MRTKIDLFSALIFLPMLLTASMTIKCGVYLEKAG